VAFGALAAASLTAGLLAPHVLAALRDAATAARPSFLQAHPSVVWAAIFVLLLLAIGGGLVAAISRLGWDGSRGSPWPIASLVVVLPLLVGFLEPKVAKFLAEEGLQTVLAAVALWGVLLVASFTVWPAFVARRLRLVPSLAALVALVVSLTLLLAWERGLNLAKQAAMGDQIFPARFGLLSVRANVVCLEPTGTRLPIPGRPHTYLGQADGTLILYDYVADLAHDEPTAFPVRLPAGAAVVRLAHYESGSWSCRPN
jgi:hypothetical protein